MAAEVFHRAAVDGYLDKLKEGNRKQMNTPDEDGCTPAMLAAQHGNLEALRIVITRGGDLDKSDLQGFTALHHAAKGGHFNCVSFLVNFGVNVWKLDNEYHTAMDLAALENRENIVSVLDMTQGEQMKKNPKMVQQLKEKALKEAERNIQYFEKMQTKASKDLERMRRQQEKQTQVNGDFKAPSDEGLFKRLTYRLKNRTASKATANGSVQSFSAHAGTQSKATLKKMVNGNQNGTAPFEFKVSEQDGSGTRTIRSVKGTMSRNGSEVLYVRDIDIGEDDTVDASDGGSRPALTGAFPDIVLKDDSNFEGGNEDDGPGIFSRPMFGKLSFLKQFDHLKATDPADEDDLENDFTNMNGDGGSSETSRHSKEELPWNADDVEQLDDDEDDTEYTPVVMFLEGCGLTHYAHCFLEGDVDMDALMRLTSQDFKDMGLPIGPQRKIMDAIQRRRVVLNEPAQMYDSQL
ncbi:USH1G-like protein [Mya arenaria]|uniref:USH1G-like protein n=1 Tax=Mya arenaria TaxID=6604 RepID=A0ABY7DJ03_MYAAR|nr:pre-mRNA splicing regulator USH1G-like [Mya arenaria]WAQ96677.1 USH1G-like protein [Mya arenaria]